MPDDRYLEREVETMPRHALREVQERRILELLPVAYENSSFYRELWDSHGVHPRDVKSLEGFQERIPSFSKDMVREHRARTGDAFGGRLCVAASELNSITSSSGTTGDPEFFAEIWDGAPPLISGHLRDLWELGLRPGDRVLSPSGTFRNLMDYGYHALGAVVISADMWFGRMREVLEIVRRYRPAYMQIMYPQLVELEHLGNEYDLKEIFSCLKAAGCAGQPISPRMRQKIQDEWGIELYEFTSAADTGTAWECREHDGFHLWEDMVYAECLDPSTSEPVEDLAMGELVATDLDNPAAPLIRYRSEDLVRLTRDACSCGRTHGRMWVAGRRGEETLVRGRLVTLRDVWQAVEAEPETVAGVFQIVRASREVDRLHVRVGYDPSVTGDIGGLTERLREGIAERTGVEAHLELRTEEELMSTVRSAAKFPRLVKR
ncbi:hypothetical protein AB0L25_39395 [Spirillospora sp. NPDC052242]